MRTLRFDDFEDFAAEVSDMYDSVCEGDDLNSVCVVALYEEAKKIIEQLVCIGHPIVNVTLNSPEIDDYADEYVIDLNSDGIWCEPAKRDTGYIWCESDVCYVLDNCSSKVIPYVKGDSGNFEVFIDEMDDCSDEHECGPYSCNHAAKCGVFDETPLKTGKTDKAKTAVKVDTDDLKYSEVEDGDLHGITVSKSNGTGRYESYSIYSTKEYSIEALKRLLPEWFK